MRPGKATQMRRASEITFRIGGDLASRCGLSSPDLAMRRSRFGRSAHNRKCRPEALKKPELGHPAIHSPSHMAASLLRSLGFFAPSPLGQGAYGQVRQQGFPLTLTLHRSFAALMLTATS